MCIIQTKAKKTHYTTFTKQDWNDQSLFSLEFGGKKGMFDDVWIVSAATQSTVIGLFNVIIYNNVSIFHVIICKYKDSTAMPE